MDSDPTMSQFLTEKDYWKDRADRAEREVDSLKLQLHSAKNRAIEATATIRGLQGQFRDVQKDKERIDWLDSEASSEWWHDYSCPGPVGGLRAKLDAAMEVQP